MLEIHTDLAMESHQLWIEKAGKGDQLSGVKLQEEDLNGFTVTCVDILNQEGETALGKPCGSYLTMDVAALWKREEGAFRSAVQALAVLVKRLLPAEGAILVAGLGNPAMTADALGPRMLDHLLITRHLRDVLPGFRNVAGLGAGVLGTTGMEAAEWVNGASDHVKPAVVIVVDALAARSLDRLCSSIQISDTGLIPGSGVGNHRMALNREGLGVPVISVGVPTVVSVETAARDLLSQAGGDEKKIPHLQGRGLFVTPENVDIKIKELAKVLGYGLNLAFHPELELEDLEALLA